MAEVCELLAEMTGKQRALRCLAHNRGCPSYRRGWCQTREPCSYREKEEKP